MAKEGAFSQHIDATATRVRAWGVYIVTLDSGDKITFTYQNSFVMKDGALKSGKNTWQMVGGTGKMKGIKGAGTCTFTPGGDGADNYSCTGDHTLGAAAAGK
jgi:hypothetical protein